MTFGDAFWPAFLANMSVVGIAAIPLAGFWLFVKIGWRKLWIARRRFCLALGLKLRFLWLVLRHGEKKSEYKNWSWLERIRKYNLELVSQGPKARANALTQFRRSTARIVANFDTFLSLPARDLLIEAANSLTLGELNTPLESDPHPNKATWLVSQSPESFAKWSLTLNDDDRKEWISWLASPDSSSDIQSALSVEVEHPGEAAP